MTQPTKPSPAVSPWSKPFWEAASQGRLSIQRCDDCQRAIFYPRYACPHCGAENLRWVDASGRGRIYSFTVVESNAPSAFQADMPFVVAVVILEEGVRMLTNIVQCDLTALRCEMPVEVVFERLNDEFVLPKFKPSAG